MLNIISKSTFLLLLLYSNTLFAQQEVTITAGDTTVVNSRLISFNAFAEAVGVDILSETEYSGTTHLRLWGPLSHSFAARFLDVSIESDQISGKWYATWINNSRQKSKKELYKKWNCTSDICTVSNDFGSRSGCLIKEADTEAIRSIRNLVFESGFIELLNQPLDRRVQLDGKSLHVEILNEEGYRFVSFMHYHIQHHPQKQLIDKARTVLGLWQ
ncbi:hypothetical protein [Gracilimonas sediminicola]|uniref:Uncharacterized protein n=1 Tax=Gracilimonas sediminicola TaxID=2952158 RepID=A0A9X2RCX8_9BACT|nr:hypothetical protein [Gracilimonas sediminicola]MCP9290217.1 hypothetical protein [Gracilimonas sediminicola]